MKVKAATQKEAFIEVTATVLGQKKTDVKRIKIRPFVTDTANVGIKYGLTIPTGDYASARVDVMINCPCYVEEMVGVFNQVVALADKLVERETAKMTPKEKR